jgi:diacylglycerol kinase
VSSQDPLLDILLPHFSVIHVSVSIVLASFAPRTVADRPVVREHVIPLTRLQYRFPTKLGELVMKTTSFWHSIRCALSGMRYVWRSGRNAKIEVVIAVAVVIVGLCLPLSRTDWAILVLTIGVVLAAEAANTSIEAAVDLASPEYHDLAKLAKDVAAGAVLILAIAAIVIGLFVLGPPLLERLKLV